MNRRIYIPIIIVVLLLINNQFAFGVEITSTQHGNVAHGETINYCTTDPDDNLMGFKPSTDKDFGNIVTADGVPLTLINNIPGGTSTAVISPSTLGPGSYQFYYNNPSQVFYVEITVAPTLTSSPTGTICSGVAQNYTITTDAGGNMDWSRAAVAGIAEGASTGINLINETLTNTTTSPINVVYDITPQVGCPNNLTYTLTVNPAPSITSAAAGSVCSGLSHTYVITSNIGGTTYSWSRAAVAGITEGASTGTSAIISETLTNTTLAPIVVDYDIIPSAGGCDGSVFTYQITVNPNPVVSISGLDYIDPNPIPWYCDSDYPLGDALTGSPAGGVFTGPGINDLGGGNAEFFPATAGLGLIDITYTYTDGNGCTSPITETTRVGTQVYINGLLTEFCETDAPDDFNYTPFDATSVILLNGIDKTPALIDGTASFDPADADAVIGANTITYQYTDASACVNEISQNVDVFLEPVANFSGLSAAYCENDGDVILTGNYAPSGTFSGDGITDIPGTGTATFSPSSLAPGVGYNVTYTYTTGLTCSDSETKPVTIYQAPNATISGTTTTCEGIAKDLTFTFSFASDYTVVYTDGTNNYTVSNPGNPGAPTNTFTQSVTPADTTTYTLVSVTDDVTGCSGTVAGSATIDVIPGVNITTQPIDKVACPGDNISFTVVSEGKNLTYDWEFDNGGGFGSVGALQTYAINGVDAATHEGTYRVTVNSMVCPGPETSDEVTLSVGNTTVITTQPLDVSACWGTSHNLEIIATGDNLTYEWRENGVAINTLADPNYVGDNTSVLTINNLDNAYDGNVYTCYVSGDCGDELSNPATVTVDDEIIITTQPTNKTACPASNVNYTVTATGTNLSYQWQERVLVPLGAWTDIGGAIGNNLVLSNVTTTEAGKIYRCEISSPCGEILYSDDVSLTLYDEINITSQPADDAVCETSAVNFQVVSDGSNLSYQWEFNDGAGYNPLADIVGVVTGSTSSSLTLLTTALADEGLYRCVITNLCGSENSDAANLVVDEAAVITSEPTDVDGCANEDINFVVAATGTNLLYQWQYNDGGGYADLLNGAHISGSGSTVSGINNPALAIDNIAAGDDGDYRCLITNGCGTETSSSASLTLHATTTLNPAFPTDKSKCIGDAANFTVDVTGGTVVSYQWQFDDGSGYVDLADGVQASGSNITLGSSNSNTLSVNNLFAADAGSYRCVVTGVCGIVYSDVADLAIDLPVNITFNPSDKMACETEDVTYTVVATGSGLTYQWWEDNGGAADAPIGGAVNPNLVLTNIDGTYEDDYYCVVSNSCNSQTSAYANLTLYTPITIIADPANISRCEGGDASFNITVDPTSDSPAYQWYQDGNPLADGLNVNNAFVTGSSTNSLFITDITTAEAGVYTCEVSGPCNVESRTASLIVNDSIIINTNPTAKQVCAGTNTSFIVNASGDVTAYQWQYDDLGGGGFVDLANDATYSGVATTTLTITNVAVAATGVYRCEITGSCIGNIVYSNSASLTIALATSITSQPTDVTDCEGQDISFTLTAEGANLIYEWYKNPAIPQVDGGDISGATTNALSISNIDLTDEGVYYCIVSGTCGSETSANPTLTVNEGLTINTNPVSKTVCEGSNTSYVVNVSGNLEALPYQWQYNDGSGFVNLANGPHPSTSGSNVSGVLTNTLNITGVGAADAGTYRCVIDGVCEDQNSVPAGLTVASNTAIVTNPLDAVLCEGDEATFSVDATGTGLTYEWYKASQVLPLSDGGSISGSTTNTLTITGLVLPDADVYSCVVSGFCTNETSLGANLDVNEHIVINTQPVNKLACPGGATSFSVSASGSIVSYQWYKDGVDISTLPPDPNIINDNTATLSINNLTAAYAGDYRCEIIGDCETVNTNTASLTINVTTTSTDPVNVTDCEDETVSFSVTTTGTALTYEWYKNGVQVFDGGQASGSTFSGTSTSTLVIYNAKPADNGSYHCFVDGQCTDITTNTAQLTIHPSTAVTLQPSDFSVVDGGTATFTITAEGDIDSYQWYKNGIALANGGNISGADLATLTIDPVAFGVDEGDYHCVVISAACGNATSNTATLTILPSTYVTTQPVNTTKCEGEDVILSITTTGGPHTYEWQFDDGSGYVALIDGAHISGSGSTVSGIGTTSLVITNIQPADEGFYRCVLNGGTDATTSALVSVNEAITITSNPLDKQRCIGDPVTFSVGATGGINQYQWYNSLGAIAGENTSAYTIPAVNVGHADSYYCIVEALGTCANVTSASAELVVNDPTVLNSGPADQLLCEGGSTTLSVDATGSNLDYQWYFNSNILADGGAISGSQEKDLVISNALTTNEGNYYCEIVGSCGTETTVPVNVTVDDATTITTQPISRSKCIGDQVQFSIVAEGTNLSYQWYHNGVSMGAVAQNPVLTINPIIVGDDGNYYCEITSGNGCGDITSNAATLTLFETTAIVASPADETICEGASTTLTASATGGNLTYIWIRDNDTLSNGANLNGVNTANLEIIDATIAETGTYWCSVTGFCGPTVLTTPATITVDPSTLITTQPISSEICEGDSKLFIVEADGIDLTYDWRLDGGSIGVATSQLTIDPVTLLNDGIYTCFVSSNNGCGDVLTTPATLTVHETTVINSSPLDRTECEGANTTFTVDAVGGNLQYQWIKDGVTVLSDVGNISGANTKDLLITGVTLADDGVYTCEVSGSCGDLISDPAELIVNPITDITLSPVSKSRCNGTSVTFYTTATGSNITYQWQKGTTDLNPGLQVSGSTVSNETTSALTITNLALLDAGSYRCVVTGDCGTQNSDPAILTMYDTTYITSQPTGGIYCEGDEITLNVASGGDNLTYQWKKDGVAISDTGLYTGALSNTLVISNVTSNYAGVYSCLVTGSCGSENSTTVNVQVNPQTIITKQPVNKVKCEGDAVVFTVTATGSNLNYQWQKDGAPLADGGTISGATTPILTISSSIDTDDGIYRCIVTGDCGTVNSDAANLLVNVYPDPALAITGPIEVCQGNTGIIYEVAAIANADYYIWSLPVGVTILSGDSTRLIEVEFDTNELGGNISVRGLNDCGYGTASPILTVVANPIPSAQAGIDQSLCVDFTNLTATDPGTATGTWSVIDGPAIVQDINLNTSYVSNLREGTNTFTWVVEENGCSSIDTIIVINNHVDVEAGTDQTICAESLMLDGSAVPIGATGSWSVTTGNASFNDGLDPNAIASSFDSGINVLRWTITKNGCSNYDTVLIDNQRPSEAQAGIDLSICGDSTVLNANDPLIGTGLWTVVTGAATFEDNTLFNTKVTGLSKGDNILRWTISNGICSTSDELTVTNNKIDVHAGVDQIICSNITTLDATALASGTGYWSVNQGAGVFVDFEDPKTVVTGLSQGTNVLTWNVNNNSCISSDSVYITNDAPTAADAGKDTTILTDVITLQGNIPSKGTGSWSLISGSGDIDNVLQNNTLVSSLGLGDNIFRWTITNNSCISTDDVIVTNANAAPPDAGPNQTICTDYTTLEGNEPVFGYGEWSVIQGSATFVDNSNPTTEVTGLAKGDNILRWSIWINGWSSDSVIITNDSPTDANAGIDRVLCADSVILAGNEPIVGTGKWTVVSGAGTFENDTIYNTKVTNLAKGDNVFKWTISHRACSNDDLVTVTNDLPTVAYAGIDQELCVGEVTLSPNTPSVGTGVWSVAQGAAFFDGNTAKSIALDTNIFVWTIENNACSYSDSITIINNEPQDANAGADKIICVDTITLAANPVTYGTGVWTQESGSSDPFNTSDPTASITNLGQGLNVFKWTITYNSCQKSDRVTINNASVTATTGPDQVVCSESTYLEANNPSAGTGMWSVLGGSGSANFENINEPNTLVTDLDKGDNILRWTITNEICSDYSEVTISNSLPTEAFAGPDQALCADNSILQGNTPIHGTGEWSILSGSADITNISDPSSEVANLDYGINTLRWTITNGSCISTDEVVIANNSTITSNAGLDQTLCEDSTLLFANIPAYGVGTWSVVTGAATFENNNDYNTKVYNVGRGDNVLKWVIANGGCSSSDEVTVTNNSPSNAIAGGDQTICGNTTFLQANNPTYGTGTWSLVSGAATFANSIQNNTEVTDLNPGSNTLRWTIENSGCTSSDDVVIYNDLPYEADAGEDYSVCGPTASLFANDPVSGVGVWTVISGSGTFDDASRFDANVSDLGFGANTLRWTITYDQCTTTDEIIITNNKTEVYAGPDETVDVSTTMLTASNPSTGTGEWSVIGGSGNFVEPNNAVTQVTNLGAGLNTFRWSVNINNCISFDDVSITYNVPPEASFVITRAAGCPPLDVYFVNNSLDGLPFTWDFDDGTTSDQVSFRHTYNESGVYKPSLTIIGENGEVITKDTTITVYPQPQASFIVVNKEVYIPEEEAIFINESLDGITYQWDFGDGDTSTESDPRHTYSEEGIYDVELQVWSENDCYDVLKVLNAVEVYESGQIEFPNAFTPNLEGSSGGAYNPNDFSNDVFFPIGEGIDNYRLEVFNRWGVLVFESEDINIGWDGYYDNKLLEEGVYVWKVTGKYNNGKDFKKVGTVLLLH